MISQPHTVHGVDGRVWEIEASREWSLPHEGDGFEHDVSSSSGSVVVLSALTLFWVLLLVWSPANVIIPWPLWVLALIILSYFPARWLLKHPVLIVVSTEGSYDFPAERWAGQVRGLQALREERRIIVRRLRTQGTPGYADSPLQPVELPMSPAEHRPTVVDMRKGRYTDLEPSTIPNLKPVPEEDS